MTKTLLLKRQPVSHRNPPNPGGQSHLNRLARSLHVPPLKQGLLAHSSISKKAKNGKCTRLQNMREDYAYVI